MSWEKILNYRWENIAHWLFFLIIILILSVSLVTLGILWINVAPNRYNWRWGYKIFVAKSGKAGWEYANRIMGKTLLCIGLIAIPASLVIMLPYRHQSLPAVVTIGCLIILTIAVMVFATHLLIKKKIGRKYLSDVES